jgi:hypothetical protein
MTHNNLNRQQQRAIDRQVRKLIRKRGDNCMGCNAEFTHPSLTFVGRDRQGKLMLVGKCCKSVLTEILNFGLYCSKDNIERYEALSHWTEDKTNAEDRSAVEPDKLAEALDIICRSITKDDELAQEAKFAGVGHRSRIIRSQSEWKEADAAWFEEHPDRFHRARAPFPGELDQWKIGDFESVILVRQIKPGFRSRRPIAKLTIPDDENFIHALFDLVIEGRGFVDPNELAARINIYRSRLRAD